MKQERHAKQQNCKNRCRHINFTLVPCLKLNNCEHRHIKIFFFQIHFIVRITYTYSFIRNKAKGYDSKWSPTPMHSQRTSALFSFPHLKELKAYLYHTICRTSVILAHENLKKWCLYMCVFHRIPGRGKDRTTNRIVWIGLKSVSYNWLNCISQT